MSKAVTLLPPQALGGLYRVKFTFYRTPEGISRAKSHKCCSYIKTGLQNSRCRGRKGEGGGNKRTELLVKQEILTSYIYVPTFGNAKSHFFCLLYNVSTLNQCRNLSCGTVACKHFDSYQGYPNYRWNIIRYAKG
jgi:hypothetical protein